MTLWTRLDDWVGTQVEDHFVMIHLESGRYISLNETATEAWQALEMARSQDAIVADLTGKFDVDADTCSRSVAAMLVHMEGMGLIARSEDNTVSDMVGTEADAVQGAM